eukprot:g20178.t1
MWSTVEPRMWMSISASFVLKPSISDKATLVPTLEQKVALPPPGPVLMWAVQWDLDIRAMVDDLKSLDLNEGPSVVERYCQNEAFMNKLRKIVRNVVSQSEMIRITQEVRMKRELEKFQRMNFQKSAEEEDEDAKAWQAMMLEMTGEKPQETQIDVNVGAPAQQMSTVFEGDDAEALEAMMAVMNRKPFEAAVAEPPIPTPAPQAAFNADDAAALEAMMSVMNRKPFEAWVKFRTMLQENATATYICQDVPAEVPEPISTPAASFEGDDAAAWDAMLSVMNRKPFEDAPPEVPAPISTPAASFEGDDAAAWDAMMSAMNRKPFEENAEPASSALHEDDAAALEAMMSVVSRKPFEDATEAPAPISAESTSLQQDDAAAWDAMLSVMNRKPFEAEAAPVQASPALQGDDAAALDLMMSVVNQKPCEDSPKGLLQSDCSTEHVQVLEKSESEQSGGPRRPSSGESCTVTSFAMAESVLLVPGERRLDLETTEGVMIQAEDCDTWRRPDSQELQSLKVFLDQQHGFHERRQHGYVMVGGTRVGFTKQGATFAAADYNNNGRLSRPEISHMMRRLLYTMSAEDGREMMERADADENGGVSYDEFVEWLERNNPGDEKPTMTDGWDIEGKFVRVLQRAERVEREDGTALGAAGIGASLVMAWSEWTLKTTGCGLPAGPFGLLGATEGLSYLAVVGLVVYQLFRLATNDTKKQSSLVEVASFLALLVALAGLSLALDSSAMIFLLCLVEVLLLAVAKDDKGGWEESVNDEGKRVQTLKIEAPSMTEEELGRG